MDIYQVDIMHWCRLVQNTGARGSGQSIITDYIVGFPVLFPKYK